ncbi:hypothetical protein B0T20DRAFT_250104 [Sordaria brevicollis]|uniref:Uncharacterized protein n=1 Tax=Sordaria brevicollis TaxID=83679 RepID=A0AAE0UB67_SORBR|nr:hypothetical protein B0T20DRAFT_250104 [Sordaria brevicollis]
MRYLTIFMARLRGGVPDTNTEETDAHSPRLPNRSSRETLPPPYEEAVCEASSSSNQKDEISNMHKTASFSACQVVRLFTSSASMLTEEIDGGCGTQRQSGLLPVKLMHLLCNYYDVMDAFLDEFLRLEYNGRKRFPKLTKSIARSAIEATGLYTFMWALLRTSSQYDARGFRAILNDEVQEIDKYIQAQVLKELVPAIGDSAKVLKKKIVRFVKEQIEDCNNQYGEHLVETGKFDGPLCVEIEVSVPTLHGHPPLHNTTSKQTS